MSGPIRILFFEEVRDHVELVLFELRRGGYTPDYAVVERVEDLARLLGEESWDLVVCAHAPPRLDALAALDVLRRGAATPCIVISGRVDEELAVRCMKAGAHDFLHEGDLGRLVPAVERELREARQRDLQQQAARALRASEERYRQLVETTTDLLVAVDEQGNITFQTPSVERVLGYPPERLAGRPFLECVHPQDAEAVAGAMREVMASGATRALGGVRMSHADGSWRVCDGSGARLTGDDGRPVLVVTGRDVTERVQLEAQLQQAQKMEAIGRLAGGVAHDFNNLLTVILGYANLLLDQLHDDPLLYQEVEEIKRASDRAAALTQKLLAFSRKQTLSLRILDLNEVVQGMSDMLRRLIGEDVDLVLKLDPRLGRVRVDHGQIEQVLMNLAVNARDAMPDGGRLLIETANVTLDDPYARRHTVPPGRYVMLAVSDTGVGMDAETQARAFEPFFTTKESGKGTGLGLSTVYGIVQQCGGNVLLSSVPSRGTTLKIHLPRADARGAASEEAEPVRHAGQGAGTVLVVEDEPLVRNLVSDVLRSAGYTVLEAANGADALALAHHVEAPIDLLLTDVVMPGMSGLDLAQLLAEERPDTRILYLSGYTDDLVGGRGVLDPGRGYLQKPFTPDVLLAKVRSMLGGRAGAAQGAREGHPEP